MTERVDAYASQPHFIDHIAPLWRALPAELRGAFMVDRAVAAHARARGIETVPGTSLQLRGHEATPVIVAGIGDLHRTHRRPAAYMEHGAGQTYVEKHPSYAGGDGRRHVELFLNTSARVEGLNRAIRPAAMQRTIGCPRLDRFTAEAPRIARRFPDSSRRSSRPTIAIAFHWACRVNPETYGALEHFRSGLARLAAGPWRVIGHGHPRLFADTAAKLERTYRELGIEVERDFERILDDADVYMADNSSTLYEFAATGRPVVVLNAPWYRRHVEHGLRFWEYADVGVQINDPESLVAGAREALRDTDKRARRREEISAELYARRDGTAAQAGAAAIAEWLSFRAERAAA